MPNIGKTAPIGKEHTQSVLIVKQYYTKPEAEKWCKDHGYIISGLDETDTLYRFRQFDPSDKNFRYHTQEISKAISLVIGYPIKSVKQQIMEQLGKI